MFRDSVPSGRKFLAAGDEESLAKSTLRRARDKLKIQGKIMSGRPKGERGGKTRWHLAEHGPSDNDNE